MVPPGRSRPACSAASTIRTAIRSLTLPPGLKYSTFASTSAGMPSVTRRRKVAGPEEVEVAARVRERGDHPVQRDQQRRLHRRGDQARAQRPALSAERVHAVLPEQRADRLLELVGPLPMAPAQGGD